MKMFARLARALLLMYLWIVRPDQARYYSAEWWIERAYRKKQWGRVQELCHEYLALAERMKQPDWNYGNAIHDANQFLGLIRLRQEDVEGAKAYLLAAGLSPGSPVLNSRGPKMIPARELLERGERQVVADYVDLVARFWAVLKPSHAGLPGQKEYVEGKKRLIREWQIDIAQGRIPTDRLWHHVL